MINQQELENLTKQIVARLERECSLQSLRGRILVPVGVTARHIHLTREVLDALFGKGYELQRLRDLSQPGEFAARETVTIVGPSGRPIENVRLLGPLRSYTQVELARSDGIRLGLDLPIRRTGDLAGTPGLTLIGPRGTVILKQGAIRPTRHIHMTEFDAEKFGLSNGQVVRVKVCLLYTSPSPRD